jgi:hypothetical protein
MMNNQSSATMLFRRTSVWFRPVSALSLNGTACVVVACLLGSVSGIALAQTPKAATPLVDNHRQQDIAQHKVMALAHQEAAKCLESGQPEKQCHEALAKACKGIALGRFCGMKHSH